MTDAQTSVEVIVGRLDASMRRAVLYRENASEACMSWAVARRLHDLGLMPRVTRYQRLSPLGYAVRAHLSNQGVK